jgi:hypothetical protein
MLECKACFTLDFEIEEHNMGILDFREICSPNSRHKSVTDAEYGISNLPDDFEMFCQEFFALVKGFRIFRSVANGPDLGIDLGVEETTKEGRVKWLVSCKHYAHSNTPVPNDKESSIIERVGSWDCHGFIPFYTTLPCTTLSQSILGAEKFVKVEKYYKDKIEQDLLNSSIGTALAARYFPKSMANHYRNFITPSEQYTIDDVEMKNGRAHLRNMAVSVGSIDEGSSPKILRELVDLANIFAGLEQHRPYFQKAISDAIDLYPSMFTKKSEEKSDNKYDPTWDLASLIHIAEKEGLNKAYFIASVWSYWDYSNSNILFADFIISWSYRDLRSSDNMNAFRETKEYKEYHASVLRRGLLTPGCLGIILPDRERDIAARLFTYAN